MESTGIWWLRDVPEFREMNGIRPQPNTQCMIYRVDWEEQTGRVVENILF